VKRLREVPPGQRARLADGRVLIVSARCHEDVWAREVLAENVEWAPGRFGPKTGELFVAKGDEPAEVV
jgi:hypothetical protein